MLGIIYETVLFLAKFSKIFKKKKPKKKYGRVCLALAAAAGAVIAALAICFIPSIVKANGKDGADAYGHLSHLRIRKEIKKNGKTKTRVKYEPIDLDRYSVDEI